MSGENRGKPAVFQNMCSIRKSSSSPFVSPVIPISVRPETVRHPSIRSNGDTLARAACSRASAAA